MTTNSDEPRIPQSPAAEHSLVNLAVTNPDLLEILMEEGITSDMFFDHNAATIYELFTRLVSETGKHPTQINISSALKQTGQLEELAYYKRLYEEPQDRAYYNRNLKLVLNAYRKRVVLRHAATLALMAQNELTGFEAIAQANSFLFENLELLGHPLQLKDGQTLMEETIADYDSALEKPKGNPWGIPVVDKATRGTRLGEYTLFKGLEGNGKSAFLQQAAYYRAKQPQARPQLWITIGDMTSNQIMNRLMQQQFGVNSTNLTEGNFKDNYNRDRQMDIYGELKKLPGIPFYIVEGGWMKSSDLKRVVKGALRREKTFDVYIDYLQQFADEGDPYEATTKMSRNVRDLVHSLRDENGQHQISITAISGMNKDGEHFGAKALAHDPENIFQISLEKQDMSRDAPLKIDKKATLLVEKQRHGAQQFKIDLWFEGRFTRFSEYEGQDEQRDNYRRY